MAFTDMEVAAAQHAAAARNATHADLYKLGLIYSTGAGADVAVIAPAIPNQPSTNVVDHFRTDTAGRYAGTLPAGSYTVRVNKDGRLFGTPDPAPVAISAGGTATQDFTLPAPGSLEVTEFAMSVIVFLGIAHCGITGGHVAVDILERPLQNPKLRFVPVLLTLASAALFAAIAWFTAAEALTSMQRVSNMVRWPHWPFQLTVALGSAMYALVLLFQTIDILSGKSRGPADDAR